MTRWLLCAAIASIACTSNGSEQVGGVSTRRLLGSEQRDSVFAERRGDTLTLSWVSWADGTREERWRSVPAVQPDPTVRLVSWNRDARPDLFLTLRYEEVIAGELRAATPDGSTLVYSTGEGTCDLPEVKDVDGDGHLDVVEHLTGALSAGECFGDPYAQRCQEEFPTEWLHVLVQRDDSLSWEPEAVRQFYDSLSNAYFGAKRRLDSLLASGPQALSPSCNRSMADSLGALGERARQIVNGG